LDDVRKKVGKTKIAKNNRTELFYILEGHEEFDNIIKHIEEYGRLERMDEVRNLNALNARYNMSLPSRHKIYNYINDRLGELMKPDEEEKGCECGHYKKHGA
jgi:hypothetical protein